jgi:hypothetical protein
MEYVDVGKLTSESIEVRESNIYTEQRGSLRHP